VGKTALGVDRPSDARMSVGAAAKTTLGRFALVWDVTAFSRLNRFEHADNTKFAAALQPQMQLTAAGRRRCARHLTSALLPLLSHW
jgi:hypothetical protein